MGTNVASLTNQVGQNYYVAQEWHRIDRLFMYFNTEGLPDTATIDVGTKIQQYKTT
ncbi:unnamed protein product [marine sediment metagenome]|uniref:Uncharacterized protein n=1 Tax=marine sediment metagenome TaxID=412755 RepID=X1SJP6_9ZZZZ